MYSITNPRLAMRLLVPLDDSLQAQRVLALVVPLAERTGARVKLIRATDLDDDARFNSLERNAQRLGDAGVSVEWSVLRGVDAETAIYTTETEWQPDLIALASTKSSGLDRWLNGSVTERIVQSASTPVLVVPPALERPLIREQSARILVPLDGSAFAEQAVWVAVRLASLIPVQIVVMRAIHDETAAQGAREYLSDVATKVKSALPDCDVVTHVVPQGAVNGILEAMRDLDVDAIAMSTRGHHTARHAPIGGVASEVFDQADVPLILLGPGALFDQHPAEIKLGAQVRSLDKPSVGEVHRVVVNLDQRAVVSIVVLGRGGLSRDVLVPVDYIQSSGDSEVQLGLTSAEFDDLPDFAYNEFVTPPATWTSTMPAAEHKRMGAAQHDLTRHTQLIDVDGVVGTVESIEWDPETGGLNALGVRGNGIISQHMRVKPEWVQCSLEQGSLQLAVGRNELAGYLGDTR
jgi:nucleotide-binding universal stress UspA family protein